MSTATVTPPRPAHGGLATPMLQIASAHRPAGQTSFLRQLRVEARKLVDNRAGFWLMVAGLVLNALAVVAMGLITGLVMKTLADHPEQVPPGTPAPTIALTDMVLGGTAPMILFLVIMGIVAATNEWTTRSALTTFALQPRRGVVLAAKVVVILALTLLLCLVALPLGAAATGIAQSVAHVHAVWSIDWARYGAFVLTSVVSALFGMGWGLLTMSTVAGVALYFCLPILMGFITGLGSFFPSLTKIMLWIDPGAAGGMLTNGHFSLTNWAAYGLTQLVWVAIPFVLGVWRWMRREAK